MAEYHIKTTGSDGAGDGSLGNPWKSWSKGFAMISAGDILSIHQGTYTDMQGLSGGNYCGVRIAGKNGTAGNLITVRAYPGEARPVLDCSSLSSIAGYHRGILMDTCAYWNFFGLIIKNVREYTTSPTTYTGSAWENQTVLNMNIEFCDVTYCMNGFTLTGLITNLNYINCDSYENWDIYQGGDLCNGFNGNVAAGSTVNYTGCRAWKNCDDGFDNMAGGGFITYRNCWAFNNKAWHGGDEAGNGDGFKLGYSNKAAEYGYQRTLYNCISAYNGLMGFDESMDAPTTQDMALYNCIAYLNNDYYSGFRFNVATGSSKTLLRNNIAIVASGKLAYAGRSRNTEDHNSWDSGIGVANINDFVNVSLAELSAARSITGALPSINAFHLVSGSDLRSKGVLIPNNTRDGDGKLWQNPPSIGPFEFIDISNIPVTSVIVTGAGGATTIVVDKGTLQMYAEIVPSNATNKNVTWSVVNGTGQATISSTGLLTAVKSGTVTVKATSVG
jgi:hypothetical protein